MSNPAAPEVPQPPPRPEEPPSPGVVSDPDAFGPDGPNVRSDDPPGGQSAPLAPPPGTPTATPDQADFAPDEA